MDQIIEQLIDFNEGGNKGHREWIEPNVRSIRLIEQLVEAEVYVGTTM